MSIRTTAVSLSALGLCLTLLAAGVLHAKPATDANHATTQVAKKNRVTKVTHQRAPSDESTAERDRRMFRECKGMHNAGACRGYTRR